MKYSVWMGLVLLSILVIISLIQVWFAPFDSAIFLKIMLTGGILLATLIVVTLAIREFISEAKLKQDGFID